MTENTAKIDPSQADDDSYILGRDYAAACRLNLQHLLWKDSLGFNCHASIPLNNDSIIADVATGTALWSIEVSRELPGAHIDAFDVDLSQAPHPQWLSSNISLRQWNMFENPPEDVVGKYDFIHTRLLVGVIHGRDRARTAIHNLLKLLKPGGNLQWDELDPANVSVKRVNADTPAPAMEQINDMSWSKGTIDWTLQIPQWLAEDGFRDVRLEHYGDRDDMIRPFHEMHLTTLEEVSRGLLKAGKKEEAMAFPKLLQEAHREAQGGAALFVPRFVCLARKPE
ncbi:MAG: hypothetical protein Q9227_005036 [Pyrenula ochraceoflavens]